MKSFKSKIDLWYMLILFGVMSVPLFLGIKSGEILPIVIFGTILSALIYWIITLRYIIEDGYLKIYSTKIEVSSIRRIEKSRSLQSSPAYSFDRIEILYNKFDNIIISPKNKEEFVAELLKINPNIEIKL